MAAVFPTASLIPPLPGLPQAVIARCRPIGIAMAGGFDSLNVAATSAVALHHLTTTALEPGNEKAAPRDGLSIVMTAVRWDHEAPLTRGGTPRKQESGSQLPTTAA